MTGRKTVPSSLPKVALLKKIIEAMHLSDKSMKTVYKPCTSYLLIDKDGELAHEDFNYLSVIGQLNYLQGHSDSEITLDTS